MLCKWRGLRRLRVLDERKRLLPVAEGNSGVWPGHIALLGWRVIGTEPEKHGEPVSMTRTPLYPLKTVAKTFLNTPKGVQHTLTRLTIVFLTPATIASMLCTYTTYLLDQSPRARSPQLRPGPLQPLPLLRGLEVLRHRAAASERLRVDLRGTDCSNCHTLSWPKLMRVRHCGPNETKDKKIIILSTQKSYHSFVTCI